MTYVPTRFHVPEPPLQFSPLIYSGAAVFAATGQKVALIGQFWNPTRTAKSIRKVGFRFGSVTKAGGSGLTVSLQDVSLSANPPQPDGTQDQTVAIANGDAAFATTTWILTGALSADRAVNHGNWLAVVIEFDGGGRLGADSVSIAIYGSQTTTNGFPTVSNYGASWVTAARFPDVLFECSDGSYATFRGSFPSSNSSSINYHLTSTPDEHANQFRVPYNCKIDGFWALISPSSSSDFEFILYAGTTALATLVVDASTLPVAGQSAYFTLPSEITLAANTDYTVAIRPTVNGSGIVLYYVDVAVAGHLGLWDIDICQAVNRTDQGAWSSPTTTRRYLMGVSVSAIDDGSGGGGGSSVKSHSFGV